MMILEAARWAPSSCNSPPLTLHLCATGDAGLGQARGSADPEQLVVGHQGVGDGRTCVHLNDAADAAPGEENDLSAYKRSELRVDRPLRTNLEIISQKAKLAGAIRYALSRRESLTRFLDVRHRSGQRWVDCAARADV